LTILKIIHGFTFIHVAPEQIKTKRTVRRRNPSEAAIFNHLAPATVGNNQRIRLDYLREGSGNGGVSEEANTPDSVEKQLETLPGMSRDDLAKRWQKLFHSPPDPKIRKPAMIRFLSYRIQEQAYGPLSVTSERRLRQRAAELEGDSSLKAPSARKIQPGTRLVREWQNQVHLVNVEAKCFEYRGTRYRSLSEIARRITGTRWSGPLFFGLKNKPDNHKEIQ
jgi:hypothetical protein